MISDLTQTASDARWYAPIIFLQVTGYGGYILVKEYHYGAQHLYPPSLVEIVFTPPVLVHQIMYYTLDIHYNIRSSWVVHNSPSGYMYCNGYIKSISHLSSMCCSYPLNYQVLFVVTTTSILVIGNWTYFGVTKYNILSSG